jgi:hypothetical protein
LVRVGVVRRPIERASVDVIRFAIGGNMRHSLELSGTHATSSFRALKLLLALSALVHGCSKEEKAPAVITLLTPQRDALTQLAPRLFDMPEVSLPTSLAPHFR